MINEVQIKNYKSIKSIDFTCRKINVFIGDPNSGKSNIIEAMSLQSQNAFGSELNKEMFRYRTIGDLFYNSNINEPITVDMGGKLTKIEYAFDEFETPLNHFNYYLDYSSKQNGQSYIDHAGNVSGNRIIDTTNVRYYEFKRLKSFVTAYQPHLSVPFGENIPTLLLSNPSLKKWVSELFRSFGFKLMLKPVEGDISMTKEVNEELYDYPYFTISETLQRLVFYTIAINSNSKSVILFDEPESNMFPFYIKEFAERLTEDESNQFFITTHNPYLLGSLLDKTSKNNINVFITKMVNYETTVNLCTPEQIEELISLGSGSFLSLDNILQ